MTGQYKPVVEKFDRAWYALDLQSQVTWMGRKIVKAPTDMVVVQEIIWETRPELVIETGVFHGASALFYAHVMDCAGIDGKVVSVDKAYDPDFDYPRHPKVEFLLGMSSIDPAVIEAVGKDAATRRTMVILDSDHSCDHVLQELRLYHRFVSKDCYLIVEDTNPAAYASMPAYGPRFAGPREAVKAWQPVNHGFEVDKTREKFLLTFHPGGYLRRVR